MQPTLQWWRVPWPGKMLQDEQVWSRFGLHVSNVHRVHFDRRWPQQLRTNEPALCPPWHSQLLSNLFRLGGRWADSEDIVGAFGWRKPNDGGAWRSHTVSTWLVLSGWLKNVSWQHLRPLPLPTAARAKDFLQVLKWESLWADSEQNYSNSLFTMAERWTAVGNVRSW